MTKQPNKIQIIKRFLELYLSKFDKHPDSRTLLMSMIADGITDPERLRNFMIVHDYYEILAKNNGRSSNTVIELAETYNISERQVQNILYKWSAKYREASNVAK
ncbi:MAG: hypothetical protein KatS3mg031_1048 [Chitinophagales bacterium]|nr:MAG: hypothetical protein KatS3mg031_1048 [Chitinophagales bacterium]